jgi:hypothetical protein
MRLLDAAEQILIDAKGEHLKSRDICDKAIQRGLITPTGKKPWTHMQSVLMQHFKDNKSFSGDFKLSLDSDGWYLVK